MTQKMMKLTITTEWTFLDIGEGWTSLVTFANIDNLQYTLRKRGGLQAAMAWSNGFLCHGKMVMFSGLLLFRL